VERSISILSTTQEVSVKTILSLFALGLLSLIPASLTTGGYAAERYPTRPVKIIQPYPAGGPGDVIARVLAQKLSEQTGGQFYVENLPGAGGTIGAGAASKAPADGYTILMINQDFVVQPIIKSKVPYDAFNGFAPVGLVATAPEMISVHPSVPARDVKELIALLKANPAKYSYATPGHGTSPHLACERLFRISHGLDVIHVPFQGGAPAVQSTIAGHTQIIHIIAPALAPQLKEGTLRALAVASKVRSPAFPDVPTLQEAGVPNHEVAFWMGGLVPVGTPREIIELLQAQFAKAMAAPDVKQRLAVLGFEPAVSTSEQFAAHMKAESEIWKAVVRDANIKIE
jgi:tripartite-type tricarboxylate transporter receptor subunit TctC